MTKEEKAKQYAELINDCYTNDYYGFIAGYESVKEVLLECKEAIEWYMEHCTPDNEEYQTFHDLGMNLISKIENESI